MSDEVNCPPPGCGGDDWHRCPDNWTCIPPEYICDGMIPDCPDGSDEENCDIAKIRPAGSVDLANIMVRQKLHMLVEKNKSKLPKSTV
jgi:hypothetical protein